MDFSLFSQQYIHKNGKNVYLCKWKIHVREWREPHIPKQNYENNRKDKTKTSIIKWQKLLSTHTMSLQNISARR